MGRKITSIIEVSTEGYTMKDRKKHRDNPSSSEEKSHSHHYKSEASSDKNRFFHHVKTNKDRKSVV